ncbi:F-box/kelch-repeat protein At3g06240-like [Neltuma alba]|uniref:F-box/kelch-repeat protein At3g06240-like n=1 Tax=Neltuma alba TaxID=207710 RepID=UPI0010A2BD69|nr:F-box/kelch-repeat protein At3g06240-like [Prosopis alba]
MEPFKPVSAKYPTNSFSLSAFLYGFGYDSFTDDYLIVLALYNSNSSSVSGTEIHIFSVRTNSWKQLEGCFTFISPIDRPDPSTGSVAGSTLNGAIHWLALCAEAGQASSHAAIISLDLTEKSLRNM